MTIARAGLLLLAAALAGFSPFEREEENVRAGNARLREGDAAGALRRYDDAERAVGRRPEIDFDRGHAALREGRAEEAEARWGRAAAAAPAPLASRALQNVGTVRARAGDREGAARAFADALAADPSNEDARWNLEVLLRQEAERGRGGDDRAPPAGAEARPAPGAPERGPPREPPDAREPPAAQEEPATPREDPAGGGDRREPRSRQEAEALLDALRAAEKDPPLFGRERREPRRADGEKDW